MRRACQSTNEYVVSFVLELTSISKAWSKLQSSVVTRQGKRRKLCKQEVASFYSYESLHV